MSTFLGLMLLLLAVRYHFARLGKYITWAKYHTGIGVARNQVSLLYAVVSIIAVSYRPSLVMGHIRL